MICIRQHGDGQQLFDIEQFLPVLEENVDIVRWDIQVDWCSGDNCLLVEKSANAPWGGTHEEFKDLYKGILQTIDGEFRIVATQGNIHMLAVDSSYWEIDSSIPGLECIFMSLFGPYVSPFALHLSPPDNFEAGDL